MWPNYTLYICPTLTGCIPILINVGRYDEALSELENAVNKLPSITPHLAMSRGYAFMQLRKYEQALSDFEFIIKSRPDYASALDNAAYCAFMLSDREKGIKYLYA